MMVVEKLEKIVQDSEPEGVVVLLGQLVAMKTQFQSEELYWALLQRFAIALTTKIMRKGA